MAIEGYRPLFDRWLPYYHATKDCRRTLVLIMSGLEDTCVLHRTGEKMAEEVRREAGELFENYSEEKLKAMCESFRERNISPGGAADMLSLTIFIESITN